MYKVSLFISAIEQTKTKPQQNGTPDEAMPRPLKALNTDECRSSIPVKLGT